MTLPRLNPAQHRLLQRHVERAVEALREADRLLKGAVGDLVERAVLDVQGIMGAIEQEQSRNVRFQLDGLSPALVPYLENPFAQGLAFNRFCSAHGLSHTRGMKEWTGGNAALAARNLVFLPPIYNDLWDEGHLDKTRLINIANRNLTDEAYKEVADWVRTRRKEDVDERLLKIPAAYLHVGRRGPEQAVEAAERHGWAKRFETVEIAEDLVREAQAPPTQTAPAETPADNAVRVLRAGVNGARVAPEVEEALRRSPDAVALVERYLTAHRQGGDPDPQEVTKTIFFAHAGPMQKLEADDKLLLRHFRPVKTQKRGQLFYRMLEAIETALQERAHQEDPLARGVTEGQAIDALRTVILDLNKDPNRYLVIPDAWLGEVTRRHLYFGSRTRKEGAAYKWFRKIGDRFYLGGHKTAEEAAEREARRAARAVL